MKSREELITIIQGLVGERGYVRFDNGFEPGYNAVGVALDYVDRRIPLDGRDKSYFSEMTAQQLTMLALDLSRYLSLHGDRS